MLLDRSYSLAAMADYTQGGGAVDRGWPSESGAYEVSASLADGGSRGWDLTDISPEETLALRIDVEITGDGALELWYTVTACGE